MPADVASCSRTPFLQKEVDYGYYNHPNPEMMSGYMTLLGPGKHRQPVHVKVYRTSLEHFAVVCPQKKVCRPLGVLNLRNTLVERLPAESKQPGFVVRQRGFDTPMCLTFIAENPRDLDDWIVAFTSRSSPTLHQSSLPIVEEDEEV
uniref:PH domain-containing protein n=1 Tax=Homalodisca liturata TaxID=320908 RepID=A0A1B6HB31_9HEMI